MNNVVSKMLIVLQLVFSLLFMCFAGAVYTFQQSWRDKATQAQQSVTQKDQLISQLTEDRKRELELVTADLKVQKDLAQGEEGRRKQLEADLQTARGELAQTQQQRDKHLADLQVAQAETEARIAEAVDLRTETRKLRETVSEQLADLRDREDRNLSLNGLIAEAKERESGALDEIERLQNLLRYNKIDPRETAPVDIPEVVKVDGVVEATLRNSTRSAELVMITIGSDDRVSMGMLLDVYRADKWLGQIRITEVFPDKAIGQVVEKSRNGNFARGDNVTTKL
jgi:competence protein ComGC